MPLPPSFMPWVIKYPEPTFLNIYFIRCLYTKESTRKKIIYADIYTILPHSKGYTSCQKKMTKAND